MTSSRDIFAGTNIDSVLLVGFTVAQQLGASATRSVIYLCAESSEAAGAINHEHATAKLF